MNKVEGFLKAEIEKSRERKNGNGMYDGVHVGIAQANQLLDRHMVLQSYFEIDGGRKVIWKRVIQL